MWRLLLSAAFAADADEMDDGEDLDVPVHHRDSTAREDGFGLDSAPDLGDDAEDDPSMTDFVAEAKRKAPPPTWFHLQPAGKVPLADNFEVHVVSFSEQYVVVQLPVVVATNRAAFVVEHPHGLTVVAEIESGPHKLVQRQEFTSAGVLADSPTIAFFEVALPFTAKSGTVRYTVKSAEWPAAAEDPKRKGSAAPPPYQARFSRTATFTRP